MRALSRGWMVLLPTLSVLWRCVGMCVYMYIYIYIYMYVHVCQTCVSGSSDHVSATWTPGAAGIDIYIHTYIHTYCDVQFAQMYLRPWSAARLRRRMPVLF